MPDKPPRGGKKPARPGRDQPRSQAKAPDKRPPVSAPRSEPRSAPRPGGLSPDERLFAESTPVIGAIAAGLEAFMAVLEAVFPLRPKHRAALPLAVRDLSRDLTRERAAGIAPNYLSDKAKLAAYARYFLPWNILRLGRLLRGITFDPPPGARLIDLGAGPLTFALALWISRPDLRARKLTLVCADRTPAPMRLGRDLFAALAPDSPWTLELVSAPVARCLDGPYQAVVAVNTVNELVLATSRAKGLSGLAESLLASLAPGGRILLVEPGTRMCARALSGLRDDIVSAGGGVLSPCTHAQDCPLTSPRARSWCHFSLSVAGAPLALAALSHQAGLPKSRLSLSYLLAGDAPVPEREHPAWRVVSEDFALPGGSGRYACGPGGLILLRSTARGLVPGDLLRQDGNLALVPAGRDVKTGATQLDIAQGPGKT